MDDLPSDLLQAIPADAVPVVRTWWASLDDARRRQVAGLWDERLEVRFFAPQADDAGVVDPWEQVPRVVGGRFLSHDDAWGLSEWGPGYFEPLLKHPELVLVWDPANRTFHFGCTHHASARGCLESGLVPARFVCPLGSEACPYLPLRGSRLTRPAGRWTRPSATIKSPGEARHGG